MEKKWELERKKLNCIWYEQKVIFKQKTVDGLAVGRSLSLYFLPVSALLYGVSDPLFSVY